MTRPRGSSRVALGALVSAVLAVTSPAVAVNEPTFSRPSTVANTITNELAGASAGAGLVTDDDIATAPDVHVSTRDSRVPGAASSRADDSLITTPVRTRDVNGNLEARPSYTYQIKSHSHAQQKERGMRQVEDKGRTPERQGADDHQTQRRLSTCCKCWSGTGRLAL